MGDRRGDTSFRGVVKAVFSGVEEVEGFFRLGGARGNVGGPITAGSEVVREVVGVTGVVMVVTLAALAVFVLETMSGIRDCLTSLTLDL